VTRCPIQGQCLHLRVCASISSLGAALKGGALTSVCLLCDPPWTQGVDWWTLGILIFETLVGQPPFNDEDPMGIYQQVSRQPTDPSARLIGDTADLSVDRVTGWLRSGAGPLVRLPSDGLARGGGGRAGRRLLTWPAVVPVISARHSGQSLSLHQMTRCCIPKTVERCSCLLSS
jgi:hypothetical protein